MITFFSYNCVFHSFRNASPPYTALERSSLKNVGKPQKIARKLVDVITKAYRSFSVVFRSKIIWKICHALKRIRIEFVCFVFHKK